VSSVFYLTIPAILKATSVVKEKGKLFATQSNILVNKVLIFKKHMKDTVKLGGGSEQTHR